MAQEQWKQPRNCKISYRLSSLEFEDCGDEEKQTVEDSSTPENAI